jgi:hypothetical protein
MGSLRKGPADAWDVLELQADLINSPRLGVDENFAFPAMQFNVAAGQKEGKGSLSTLACDAGAELDRG